jgi:hypothetical protein
METRQEIWKAIAECNGIYYISDHGNAKSFKNGKEHILKPGKGVNGYYTIGIIRNGNKRKSEYIHRLVAQTFIPNPIYKKQVNHKDGDKTNNQVDNLEWCTAKENMRHAWDMGFYEYNRKVTIQRESKPVVDIVTGKKYNSLKLACQDISEPYPRHVLRNYHNSKLQRFFYINENGNG